MNDWQQHLDQALNHVHLVKSDTSYGSPDYDIFSEIMDILFSEREKAGLTQSELAERCGISKTNLAKYENGTSCPSILALKKIADGLGKRLVIGFLDWNEDDDWQDLEQEDEF